MGRSFLLRPPSQLGWRTRLLHLPDGPLAAPLGNGSDWRVAQAVLLVGPRSGSSRLGSVPAETGSKITHVDPTAICQGSSGNHDDVGNLRVWWACISISPSYSYFTV